MNQQTGNTNRANHVTVELLSEMHRNVTMGSETLSMIVPKINGREMLANVTNQLEQYGTFTGKTEKMLAQRNVTPKDSSVMKRAMTKMGIAMNTAADSSDRHIAAMIGKGTMTGLTELTGKLHKLTSADEDAVKLCQDILEFERNQTMGILEYT
ncbi:MAG: hypothetical protein IJF78_09630 [Clostridia bacterium]|nr:hypothetical protein [Clostridia bacterium]